MAFGLDNIYEAISNGVNAINRLSTNVKNIFPQLVGNSTAAPSTAGTITFSSSQAAGFSLVTLSSGVTVKVPYYNQ